ncbi:dolichyl-phosphate-mannose--protein mannosyltransferase [Tersicoccus solisilvae]|uniref:Polyprenol-phosphate-mannose--protein mannosyltransferase n=1 Tax=Tersicoccus solisilvae TaxID=1882339 RepID=A0ABQ1P8Q4_9MICC|nr:phospholipid carrier-dependent glycosyltransferase [Tersicoccus solisilvae]GGC92805.1 dolichyl-phosphate-mannose--protein mannosyltransferase [Tersicoccus solisilvae]
MSHPASPTEAEPASTRPADRPDTPAAVGSPGGAGRPDRVGMIRSARRRVLPPGEALTYAALRLRLIGTGPGSLRLGPAGWGLIAVAAVLGGLLRFVRLAEPHSLVFDETYYVKDAYSMLQSGYERNWPENANDAFVAGRPQLQSTPEYVVHPPVGKWMIAFGMWLFGSDNGIGWRFSAAAIGTLSVVLIGLAAWLLFRSRVLAGLAALLLAVDGHHLVMSRTGLLDVFLSFFLLAAFVALLLDRDDGRRRLARRLSDAAAAGLATVTAGHPLLLRTGPFLGLRPWRLLAGVLLGLAVGTKWSALSFVAVFGLMTVLWDMNARRLAGIVHWARAGILKDGLLAFVAIVPVGAVTYLFTWTGWFLSGDAWDRQWGQDNPAGPWGWVPASLRSLWHYHLTAYEFHQGLSAEHPYQASAWTWLVMGRPTSFYYESPTGPVAGCDVAKCSSAILSVGNPLIWWTAALALIVLLFWWIGRRDWRAGAVLAGVAAGYLPWFLYPERTTFFFYAVSFEPFLVLGLTMVAGAALGAPRTAEDGPVPAARRRWGIVVLGVFVAAVLLLTAFFLPIWTAEVLPYEQWRLRMWMPSWI